MENKEPRVSGDGLSREIKFRAWEYGKMEYEPSCRFVDSNRYGITLINFELEGRHDRVFMQYTGLKDKNGVEIYEGDLLEGEHTREIPYSKIVATKRGVYYSRGGFDYASFLLGSLNESCIVIGNIFENPELLEA